MKSNFHLLFYLRKQKNYKGGSMAIYMRITVNGKRADMSTGRECDPVKWNSHTGRAIGTKEEIKSLNNYLDSLQTKVARCDGITKKQLLGYKIVSFFF